MALLFTDSFGHYLTADMLNKWTSRAGGGSGAGATITTGGRTANCLTLDPIGFSITSVSKTIPNSSTLICGAAVSFATVTDVQSIIAFVDTATTQVDVRLTTIGKLTVTRNGTVLGTSASALSNGIFYYIELKATIHGTLGAYELRVNGVTWLTGTSVNTQASANAFANTLKLASNSNAGAAKFCDLYLFDDSGSTNNTFAGDVSIGCYFANSAGDLTAWTASAGSNYQCVDDATPNGDTDYVASSTPGDEDLYNFTNLSGPITNILGIQRTLVTRKDDAGVRTIKPITKSAGTVYEGTAVGISTTYVWYMDIMETDPATSAAWTTANVNAAQFGVKIES